MADTYTVVLVNKWGQALEPDGSFYRLDSGRPHFEATFADLASARAFCEEFVREHPLVECDISDGRLVVFHYFDPETRRREEEEIRLALAAQRRLDRLTLAGLVAFVMVMVAVGLSWWAW